MNRFFGDPTDNDPIQSLLTCFEEYFSTWFYETKDKKIFAIRPNSSLISLIGTIGTKFLVLKILKVTFMTPILASAYIIRATRGSEIVISRTKTRQTIIVLKTHRKNAKYKIKYVCEYNQTTKNRDGSHGSCVF